MADTMSAVLAHDYGEASVLVLDKVPRPHPGNGQVLIHLKASGVNPADWKYRLGMFKERVPLQFPWIPGLEGAGTVEAVGTGVTKFRPGQEVYGAILASYAEYALAKETDIQLKPSGISFEEAATVPVGALTAWGAVIDTAKVEAGQKVLVQGAAGGVGGYAVQLARWKGAHVTGTSSAANVDFVRSLGAETAIDYSVTPFEKLVDDFDVVIDTVGGADLVQRSIRVLHPGGIYVTVAGMLPADAGKAEGVRATRAGRAPSETLSIISELLASKQIRPLVGKIFALADASQAQRLSETGHGRGRILLRIS